VLKVWTTTVCDVTRLEAEGAVDGRYLGAWREALHQAVVSGAESVVIDVGRLTSWSVAAQAALIRAAHLARECGRRLSLANTTGTLLEQARLCGLDRQLPTEQVIDLTGKSSRRQLFAESSDERAEDNVDSEAKPAPSIDLRAAARVLPSPDARLRAARVNATARVNAATRRRSHIAGATS
jgi:anti-anti-sigma factor